MIFPIDKIYQKLILHRIAKKQKVMLKIGAEFGLNDPRTVECSQELDKLINVYQELNYIKSAEQH
ncbi:Spo0E family sporulation regulatory protein-aspartic acid phosphatase [Bacillus sp. AK031]